MVRKRKPAHKLTRSPQIAVSFAEDVQGTLPSGVSGCIPGPPHPMPTCTVPIPPDPHTDTPLPSGDISTSSRTANFKSTVQSEVSSGEWQTDHPTDDESSSGDESLNRLFGNGPGFTRSLPKWRSRIRPPTNPLLDGLADDLNALTFGLEDSDDEYGPQLGLRNAFMEHFRVAPESTTAIQCAMLRLLNRLLNDDLFVRSIDSLNALRELQATLITHPRVGGAIRGIIYTEERASRYFSELQEDPPIVQDPSPSGVHMQPPHVSGAACAQPAVVESTITESHVSRDQKSKRSRRRKRRQASS
jgi:hypothetical protein